MAENKNSKARIEANHRWEANNYDKFNVRLPKGTRERIEASGMTLNAYCKAAILEKLEKDGF